MSSGKRPAEEESEEEEEEVVLADVLQQRKAWYADRFRVRCREFPARQRSRTVRGTDR